MGYVDKDENHLLSSYRIDDKSKKWWYRLFWHFLYVTVFNAFILSKEKSGNQTLTFKEFMFDRSVGCTKTLNFFLTIYLDICLKPDG